MIIEVVMHLLNIVAIVMMGTVIWMHFQAWKSAPRRYGLLPMHVIMVSVAQIIFMLMSASAVMVYTRRVGLNWWLLPYFVGIGLTIGALVAVGEFQRRRRIQDAKL
jgi:hypothetical protein